MTKFLKWWKRRVVPIWTMYRPVAPLALLLMGLLVFTAVSTPDNNKPDTQPISRLFADVAAGSVKEVVIVDDNREATVDLEQGKSYLVVYPTGYGADLMNHLNEAKVPTRVDGKGFFEKFQLAFAIMLVGLIGLAYLWRTGSGLPGLKGNTSLRSSGVNIAPAHTPKERFSDVGGADEVIAELRQTVDALKHPEKYKRFGVRPLTGFLFTGEPGTGKTLLARAIAGEAGVPFFAIKGSDLMGRWLNDGPRAVREIFEQARRLGVAIIFIDEIDSIASKRSGNDDSGSKELNNTVNELLAQLDGFGQNTDATILVIGATNRPADLDPGILRPGRLTRHAPMPSPDPKARQLILELHAKPLGNVAPVVNFQRLARLTSGMTGAQLADLVNQAGLLAINEATDEPMVTMKHFLDALETAEVGVARKSRVVAERDRNYTAYHEGGHTVVAAFMEGAARPHRVTIIPRGASGGHTRMDEGDYMLRTRAELKASLASLMGGRAAEKLVFGENGFTTGAESDLARATELATYMVTKAGMGGVYTAQVSVGSGHDPRAGDIMSEIDKLVRDAEAEALGILTTHRAKLEELHGRLLEEESLDEEALSAMFGTPAAA